MARDGGSLLQPQVIAYLERLRPPSVGIIREMEAYASEHELDISSPATGRLLAILVRANAATRVLEVGTGVGHGAFWLASASAEVEVTSLERDAEVLEVARTFLDRGGVGERVDLRCGEAVELMPQLTGPFDFLFLDGDKTDDRRCLDLGLQVLRVGGLVAVDRLLWRGRVAGPDFDEDESAEAAHVFNGYLTMHPQLSAVILPFDAGLGLAVKTEQLVTDLGGPF